MKKIAMRALALLTPLLVSSVAFAQDVSNEYDASAYKALAAGLAIAIAAFGGALGQGRAAQAALEGIARNPSAADKMTTPLILSLALIESLVIYALLIAGGFIGPLG